MRKPGQLLAPLVPGASPITAAAVGVTVPGWGTASVQLSLDWSQGGELWFPDLPALYLLESALHPQHDSGAVLDSDTTVIGFKHVEIAPPTPSGQRHLLLNGARLNLRGTSIAVASQRYDEVWGPGGFVEKWNQTVLSWKALGVNVIRVHQGPGPEALLQGADEAGLLIIEESAVLGRQFVPRSIGSSAMPDRSTEYVHNAQAWIRSWVVQRRNHASIVYWSAENENGHFSQGLLTNEQIQSLASTVHELDPSRLVVSEGDQLGSADSPSAPDYTVTSYHYPEGYANSWYEPLAQMNASGAGACFCKSAAVCGCKVDGSCGCKSIYLPLPTGGRPNAAGEFAFLNNNRGEPNNLWHGLAVRGLRYM